MSKNTELATTILSHDQRLINFGLGQGQLTKNDLTFISYGACFLGSGGGGSIGLAELFIEEMISNSDVMRYINLDDIEPSNNLSLVAILGAPDKMFEGFGQTAPLNAFLEMNNHLINSDRKAINYLMPVEMGAINTLVPFIISARYDISVINGDPSGRAVPKMSMNLLNTNGLPLNPIILTSDTDVSGQYQKTIATADSADDAEIHARNFARHNNSLAGIACYPMQASCLMNSSDLGQYSNKFISGTVGLAWNLGRNLLEYKNYQNFLQFLKSFPIVSHQLFDGVLMHKEERRISGFDAGKITVSSTSETIQIYYKNECLLAWNATKQCVLAMGPDSISLLTKNNAQPFSNADINSDPNRNPKNISLGTEVGVIGLCAFDSLKDPILINLFLKSIRETIAAFPEDQVLIPDGYISFSELIAEED